MCIYAPKVVILLFCESVGCDIQLELWHLSISVLSQNGHICPRWPLITLPTDKSQQINPHKRRIHSQLFRLKGLAKQHTPSFLFFPARNMRQVGYFYTALDLSSGADEAPFIIHAQPADETESSRLLRSHNVSPWALFQGRNQDPDRLYIGVWFPPEFTFSGWCG